jgi:hypothetical protein
MVAAPGGVSSGNSGDDGAAALVGAAGGASTAAALTAPTSSSSPQTPEAPQSSAGDAAAAGAASAEGVAGVAALPPLSDVDATGGPSVRRTRQLCWARSSVHGLHAIIGCRAAMLVRARSTCCQWCPCCRGRPAHLPVTLQLAALQPKMRRLRSISVGAYIYKVERHTTEPRIQTQSGEHCHKLPSPQTCASRNSGRPQAPQCGSVSPESNAVCNYGDQKRASPWVRYAASVAIRGPGQQRGPPISSLTGRPPILVSQARP